MTHARAPTSAVVAPERGRRRSSENSRLSGSFPGANRAEFEDDDIVPFDRAQPFLLPPDLKDWLPADDIADFILAAVARVPLGEFRTNPQAGGKPQYHPRLMLALLVYC